MKVGLTNDEYQELVMRARFARKPLSTYVRDVVLNQQLLFDKICENNKLEKETLNLLKNVFKR